MQFLRFAPSSVSSMSSVKEDDTVIKRKKSNNNQSNCSDCAKPVEEETNTEPKLAVASSLSVTGEDPQPEVVSHIAFVAADSDERVQARVQTGTAQHGDV